MSKQTAVQYLIDELTNDLPFEIILKCHQTFIMAIELEREQIIDAHGLKYYDLKEEIISGEQYYNKTYKGGEQ